MAVKLRQHATLQHIINLKRRHSCQQLRELTVQVHVGLNLVSAQLISSGSSVLDPTLTRVGKLAPTDERQPSQPAINFTHRTPLQYFIKYLQNIVRLSFG